MELPEIVELKLNALEAGYLYAILRKDWRDRVASDDTLVVDLIIAKLEEQMQKSVYRG